MSKSVSRPLVTLTRLLGGYCKADDACLLERYKSAQDPAAFDELVHRHGPLVLGVCRRMLGRHHDADDAFQATFLTLVDNARAIRKPNALAAWLYGTAVRVCRKALARRSKQPRQASRDYPSGTATNDPFEDVAWKEVRGLLDEELSRLPDTLRDPLVLCYFNGLTRDEAAARLGVAKRTLMRRLEEGRDRLRHRLTRRGLASVGLAAYVLSPERLAALVPPMLASAAVELGIGGTAPAAVRALACGASIKLLHIAAGLLMLVAVGGGFGWAAAVGLTAPAETSLNVNIEPHVASNPIPNQKQVPRVDGDGQPLPEGAVHRLGSRRFRVEGWNGFALPTVDGKHILVQPWPRLSAYAAQGLILLDAETGLRVRTFEASRRVPKVTVHEPVRPAAFSPDGKTLYGVATHKDEINRFDPWADDHNPCKRVLLVWDVATGKKTAEWTLPPGNNYGASLLGVSVTHDGKQLFVYGSIRMGVVDRTLVGVHGLHVLDAATGKHLATWDGAGHPVGLTVGGKEIITFRNDSELVKDANITAHDAGTGRPLRRFPMDGKVPSIAISPDGTTVAAIGITGEPGKRKTEIKLWEAASGREIRRLTPDSKALEAASARRGTWKCRLVFAADGKTLYLGTDVGLLLRWNVADGSALPEWPVQSKTIVDLLYRPGKNELICAGFTDGTLRRLDAETGKILSTTDAYFGELAVARQPDGQQLAICDWTGRVDLWDITTGRLTRTRQLPKDPRRALVFSPDGKFLLDATEDAKITVRDAITGEAVREIPAAKKQEGGSGDWDLTFSPDGRGLRASKYGYGTRYFAWPDCTVVWQHPEFLEAAFSRDGKRMLSSERDKIVMRDPKSGIVLSELQGEHMTCSAFSPDGRRIVTGHFGAISEDTKTLPGIWRVRDGKTGAVLKEMKEAEHIGCVVFSPTGWLIAVASDNGVCVYDTASWQLIGRFDGHDGTVGNLFFGPDDATLVSVSSEDGTALVWSTKPTVHGKPLDPVKLWADLSGDGPAIRQAVWNAASHPDVAIRLFREKWVVPKDPIDIKRIGKLISLLNSATYASREAAMADLAKLGRRAEGELRKAVADPPSVEVKQRAEKLLARWEPTTSEYSAEVVRELRAVWALELSGSLEAQKLLAEWAAAKVGIRLCEEAEAALRRMKK